MSVLILVRYCLDYCSFVILFEVWDNYAFGFVFFFPQDCLAILGFISFHINFWIICSSSVKNVIGNLIRIPLNLWISSGHLDNINSSNPGTWNIFLFLQILFNFLDSCFIVLSL